MDNVDGVVVVVFDFPVVSVVQGVAVVETLLSDDGGQGHVQFGHTT